jgi:hypothetical protein
MLCPAGGLVGGPAGGPAGGPVGGPAISPIGGPAGGHWPTGSTPGQPNSRPGVGPNKANIPIKVTDVVKTIEKVKTKKL